MSTSAAAIYVRAVRTAVRPVLVLGLASCGADPPPSSVGVRSDDLANVRACSLLTPAEIESATGKAPRDGQDMSQAAPGLPICNWAPADGEPYDTLVNLLVTRNAYDSYAQFLESARDGPFAAVFSDDAVEEVTGLGDFGVWMRETRMLQIYDGNRMVQVTVDPGAGRDALEAARALGTAAFDQLR